MEWTTVVSSRGPSPRSSHQLSSHGSCVYLFGGENGPLHSHFGYGEPVDPSVFKLDLAANERVWEVVAVTGGSAPSPRLGHGQCVVDANVYIFGGRQPADFAAPYDGKEAITSLNDAYRFDLSTRRWETLPPLGDVPTVRSYSGMTHHSNGKIYVFGGMVNNERYSDLYSFDPSTGSWTRLAEGPMEGRGGAGLCASATSLWVVGGYCGRPVGDVWEYCLDRNEWVEHAAMKLAVPRSIFACCCVEEDPSDEVAAAGGVSYILVFGGELVDASGNEDAGVYTNETLRIDLSALGGGGGGGGGRGEEAAREQRGECCAVRPRGSSGPPAARGWTSGCLVDYSDGRSPATSRMKKAFVVFGGIRRCVDEGGAEPAGVRLGDLVMLELPRATT